MSHLPLKGKAGAKLLSLPVDLYCVLFQIGASHYRTAYSLPLEGKVSAQPTDEVFIQIKYLFCFFVFPRRMTIPAALRVLPVL